MIEPKDVVLKETIKVGKGVSLLFILMLLLCFIFKVLDFSVFLGLLLGSAYSVANFLMIGFSVETAVKDEDPKAISSYMIRQYALRYFLTGVVILISCIVDFINPFGVMVALFFPKAVIFFNSIFRKEAS